MSSAKHVSKLWEGHLEKIELRGGQDATKSTRKQRGGEGLRGHMESFENRESNDTMGAQMQGIYT